MVLLGLVLGLPRFLLPSGVQWMGNPEQGVGFTVEDMTNPGPTPLFNNGGKVVTFTSLQQDFVCQSLRPEVFEDLPEVLGVKDIYFICVTIRHAPTLSSI